MSNTLSIGVHGFIVCRIPFLGRCVKTNELFPNCGRRKCLDCPKGCFVYYADKRGKMREVPYTLPVLKSCNVKMTEA